MIKITVDGKDYKLHYGYQALCNTDIMDKAKNVTESDDLATMMKVVAEYLLVGLQEYHADEFGYDGYDEMSTDEASDVGKFDAMKKVYKLMDKIDKEEGLSVFELYGMIDKEMGKNGFLSGLLTALQEATKETKKTAVKKNK